MGRVTIVIQDKPDGHVSVSVDIDPPMRCDAEATPAQEVGLRVADIALHELTGEGRITSVNAKDADGEAVLDWTPGKEDPS